jgi:hypothetical protein
MDMGSSEVLLKFFIYYTVSGQKISSQATEYLVLGDFKSASPERNKVSYSTKSLIITKDRIDPYFLFPKEV